MTQLTQPPVTPPPPDDVSTADLHCPLCGYSLFGLPEPRCPECGYQFDWAQLIRQQWLRESWFFEHAGTWRSLMKTPWRSLRPFRFWREVEPGWSIHGERLFGLLMLTSLLSIALFIGLTYGLPPAIDAALGILDHVAPPKPPSPVTITSPQFPNGRSFTYVPNTISWVERFQFRFWEFNRTIGPGLLIGVTFFLVTPMFWLLLKHSAQRFKLRPIQFFRVTVYSLAIYPLLAALLPIVFCVWFFADQHLGFRNSSVTRLYLGYATICGLCGVVMGIRIYAAAALYLRLPQAGIVAAAYGLIAVLTVMCVILQPTRDAGSLARIVLDRTAVDR